mmetsp:Transcript_55685/g.113811  ORF Transcript_55685/g.113811 Transcript_55685/m.113811 type:complete len:189 (-) Transcript_55685:129-695(-)
MHSVFLFSAAAVSTPTWRRCCFFSSLRSDRFHRSVALASRGHAREHWQWGSCGGFSCLSTLHAAVMRRSWTARTGEASGTWITELVHAKSPQPLLSPCEKYLPRALRGKCMRTCPLVEKRFGGEAGVRRRCGYGSCPLECVVRGRCGRDWLDHERGRDEELHSAGDEWWCACSGSGGLLSREDAVALG